MRRFMILALFIALVFGFTGCGDEAEEEEEVELDISTIENAVDAFIEVVGDKDKDALKNMVIDESYFDALWPLIDELGLTIIGGYELEEGAFGTTVTFEDARYVEDGYDYVLELTFSEDKGKWLISGYLTMLAPSDGDDEEDKSVAEQTHEDELIGRWDFVYIYPVVPGVDEYPPLISRMTIFREGGKLYLEDRYDDGSIGKKELFESSSPQGRRFDDEHEEYGEYYIINSDGNLECYDWEGWLTTAKRVE